MAKKFFLFILFVSSLFLISGCATKSNEDFLMIDNYYNITDNRTFLQDLTFSATTLAKGGNRDPTIATSTGGLLGYWFSPTQINELFAPGVQLKHGTLRPEIYPHFHWSLRNNVTGAKQCVVWGLEYVCSAINNRFPTSTNTMKQAHCIQGTTWRNHYVTYINNSMVDGWISDSAVCNMRIFRDATNTTDNLTQEVIFYDFDIHYKTKTLGSVVN